MLLAPIFMIYRLRGRLRGTGRLVFGSTYRLPDGNKKVTIWLQTNKE